MKFSATFLSFAALVAAHGDHDQTPISGPHQDLWYNTLPGDGGTQVCEPKLQPEKNVFADSFTRQIQSSLESPRSVVSNTTHASRATTQSMTLRSSVSSMLVVGHLHVLICFKGLPSILGLHTALEHASAPAAFDKVLAVSISSMYPCEKSTGLFFWHLDRKSVV